MSSKKGKKGASSKYVHMCVELQRQRRNYLIRLIAGVVIGVLLWALVSFTPINDHTIFTSVVIYGAAVILVFLIGWQSVKFSGTNTEIAKIKREYGVTDEQIRKFGGK